jgi:uncharacterized membrane protein
MNIRRLLRHSLFPGWLIHRNFPACLLRKIEDAVAESELGHAAELRFAVEGALHPRLAASDMNARQRALEVFSAQRIWDTEANNGALIYLLLADRIVEIVADRGFNDRVPPEEWQSICRDMEDYFRRGDFEAGILRGIASVDVLLRRHFPNIAVNPNELPDTPIVL